MAKKKAKKKWTIRDRCVRQQMADECAIRVARLSAIDARGAASSEILRTIENAMRQQRRASLLTGYVAAIEHVNPRNARIAEAARALVAQRREMWKGESMVLGCDAVSDAWRALVAAVEDDNG